MVGINMNSPTRDQVLKFMEEKERIEREIQELYAVLETNRVDMHEPLVDREGFPRGDIDVFRVRHARHRIICLQNDHKEIMKSIEQGLHAIHADMIGRGEGSSHHNIIIQAMDTSHANNNGYLYTNGLSNGHVSNGHSDVDGRVAQVVAATNNLRVRDQAFVRINFVSPGSPAFDAGIQEDDEILEFGSVNGSNFTNLAQLADIVQHSVGNRVDIRLRRGPNILNVSLTPNVWAGRGLLGCNIIPI